MKREIDGVISDERWRQGVGRCCAYSLYRPAGTPCYVGEGLPRRPGQHLPFARNNHPHYLYRLIREAESREGPIRVRTLYEGVAKWRAKQLEKALIGAFRKEFGYQTLFNRKVYRGAIIFPQALARVRRDKHKWRLPALTCIYVSEAAMIEARRVLDLHEAPRRNRPKRGCYVWVDESTLKNLETIRQGSGGYSKPLLRLAEFTRLAERQRHERTKRSSRRGRVH